MFKETYATLRQWNAMGFSVKIGSVSHAKNCEGQSMFGRRQVYKNSRPTTTRVVHVCHYY